MPAATRPLRWRLRPVCRRCWRTSCTGARSIALLCGTSPRDVPAALAPQPGALTHLADLRTGRVLTAAEVRAAATPAQPQESST